MINATSKRKVTDARRRGGTDALRKGQNKRDVARFGVAISEAEGVLS